MSDSQITAYLDKYKITNRELLETHLEEIKRNTVVNRDIVFTLTEILCDEELFFKFFCAKNKNIGSTFFLDEVLDRLLGAGTISKTYKTEEEILNECRADLITTFESSNEGKKAIRKEDLNNTKTIEIRDHADIPIIINGFFGDSNNTGGTVFERVQDTPINNNSVREVYYNYLDTCKSDFVTNITTDWLEEVKQQSELGKGLNIIPNGISRGRICTPSTEQTVGKKESQTVKKAPVFTYCKQMKNAVEALALRSLYGHERYEKGDDWENFARVENGEFEYANASFRHALGIGEENEKNHLIAEAWNSVAKLELYLRKNK